MRAELVRVRDLLGPQLRHGKRYYVSGILEHDVRSGATCGCPGTARRGYGVAAAGSCPLAIGAPSVTVGAPAPSGAAFVALRPSCRE